ncbi:MAG: iron ABC transporter permease [Tetragenococcus halophilus]|nr:iron ABC transporter permease [Tetragenococcus halophilus]
MKKGAFWLLLGILLVTGLILSLIIGTIPLSFKELLAVLANQGTPAHQLVVLDFRLPRTLVSILAGAGLAASGYLFQGVTHNDLADPGILGINAGAGLTVLLYLGFFTSQTSSHLLPLIACLGSFLAAFLVYFCGKQKEKFYPNRLLLAGIAVNAGISALTLIGTVLLILLPFILFQGKSLEVISLGDEEAIALGVPLKKKQLFYLISAVILAAVSVSVAGSISFIGLIAPHLAKNIVNRKNNHALLMSVFIGSLLLLYSDILGRVILTNGEMAAGIIVSIIGAPYFIFRLLKKNKVIIN